MLETTVTGNVGSVRFYRSGETTVLNFSIAASRKINGREYTDWIAAKLWGDRGVKLREHITVGAKLLLRGRPEGRGFLKSDGTAASELVLHVSNLEFLSGKTKFQSPAEETPPRVNASATPRRRKVGKR